MLFFSSEAPQIVEPFYNERGTLEWPRDAAHSSWNDICSILSFIAPIIGEWLVKYVQYVTMNNR